MTTCGLDTTKWGVPMRLIVTCGHCQRQFDAADLKIGSRFRCICGKAVEVAPPRHGHDAAVIRCSACGAARGGTATKCGHCGSDFTLHERDLGTVCPQCAARVSDRARFCHHCGQPLASTPVASVATNLQCPFCKDASPLYDRSLGDPPLPAMECQRCLGLWLEHPTVEEIVRRAERAPDPGTFLPRRGGDRASREAPSADWRYRKCPCCDSLMNRHNLGRGSNVIVDICSDHGVWFDDPELHVFIDWVHRGGAPVSTRPDPDRMPEADRRVTTMTDDRDESGRGTRSSLDLGDIVAIAMRFISH